MGRGSADGHAVVLRLGDRDALPPGEGVNYTEALFVVVIMALATHAGRAAGGVLDAQVAALGRRLPGHGG